MASSTGLYGASYKGYEHGGLLPDEYKTGGKITIPTAAGVPKTKPTKQKQTHPKGRALGRKLSISSSIENMRLVPGFAGETQQLLDLMGALGDNQSAGLTGMDSILLSLPTDTNDGGGAAANRYLLNPQDVADLQPYLQNLQTLGVPFGDLSAGMTYQAAYAVYKQAITAMNTDIGVNGTTDTNSAWGDNLADIQQLLDYVGSDPAHRIITGADMGILRSAQTPKNNPWKWYGAPGSSLDQVEWNLDQQMLVNYDGVESLTRGLDQRITGAIPNYTERAANVLKLEQSEAKRYQGLQRQISALRIQDKKNALSNARKAYSTDVAKQDLRNSIAALQNEITAERAVPLGDQQYLSSLTSLKASYQQQLSINEATAPAGSGHYTRRARNAVEKADAGQQETLKQQVANLTANIAKERAASHPNAGKIATDTNSLHTLQAQLRALGGPNQNAIISKHIALEIAELQQQLTPIETSLGLLGGNKTGASTPTGGHSVYGSLQTNLSRLRSGLSTNRGYMVTAQGAVPALMVDQATMRSNLGSMFDTSTFSPVGTGASAADTTQLQELLAEQNALISQGNLIDAAITSAVASMTPLIPKYEHGGLVANTGLALVHEGERITPNPAGPYGNSTSQHSSSPQIGLHFHGPGMQELLGHVRATVDGQMVHPSNVRALSTAVGARVGALKGAPGGFRR